MRLNVDVSRQLAECNLILFYKRTYAVYSMWLYLPVVSTVTDLGVSYDNQLVSGHI